MISNTPFIGVNHQENTSNSCLRRRWTFNVFSSAVPISPPLIPRLPPQKKTDVFSQWAWHYGKRCYWLYQQMDHILTLPKINHLLVKLSVSFEERSPYGVTIVIKLSTCHDSWGTLNNSNIVPEDRPSEKQKWSSQALLFRGYVRFKEC